VIQNYKTFDEIYKKPAVPDYRDSNNSVQAAMTMGSFLYGNNNNRNNNSGNNNRQATNLQATSGKVKKSVSTKGQKVNNNNNIKNMAKTATQFNKQQPNNNINLPRQNNPTPSQFAQTSFPQQQNINIYSPFE
jgi:hypothetical protein